MKLSCPNVSQFLRGKKKIALVLTSFFIVLSAALLIFSREVVVPSYARHRFLTKSAFNPLRNRKVKLTPTLTLTPLATATPTLPVTPILPSTPSSTTTLQLTQSLQSQTPKMNFGMGPEADQALQTRLVKETPVKMLTSWFNGSHDLSWIMNWKHDLIPQLYTKNYMLHLVTFTDYPEIPLQTPYGPACGREYPLTTKMLDDMKKLAQTFAGSGELYVTLFTEFQTYPCEDNTWVGNENYYKTLKDQYRAAKQVFKEYAPNAKVGISWGGWISRWDDPSKGAGRSLIPYFDDILKESDITAFQAMESGTNVEDIRSMSKILGAYGKPIILSHYKPDNGSQTTFDADVKTVFTDDFLREITGYGLFAYSFMDNVNVSNSEATYQFIKSAIVKYQK